MNSPIEDDASEASSDDAAWHELYTVVRRLRAPDGCPWDREQTPHSLVPFLLEEAHEAADALRSGDRGAAAEELGDVILNVMMQASIGEEEHAFTLDSILAFTRAKMIRRHPHVFGDQQGADLETIRKNWKRIKSEEKASEGVRSEALRELPVSLPALELGERLGRDAARVGFDWPDASGPRDKVSEELEELDEAIEGGNRIRIEEEFGDLLLALTSLARHLGISSEHALRGAMDRFRGRFSVLEEQFPDLDRRSLAELEDAWQRAKGSKPG